MRIVEFLIEKGADINLLAEVGGSPLDEAASKGHLEVARYLVAHGASLAVLHPNRNPLFSTIYEGHPHVAKFLLEVGIDPHVVYRSSAGTLKNAFSYAQSRNQKEIVDLLVKAGCRLPIEGVDKPVWEPEEFRQKPLHEPAADDKSHEQFILLMGEVFGPVDPLALQEIVSVHDDVDVAIYVIRPNDDHPQMTLFTSGMSDRAMRVPKGQEEYQYAELLMHLPATWPHPRDQGAGQDTFWPIEWLRQVAYYPHLHETWLGGAMTIISSAEPPVPLGPNTRQTCLLLLANDTPILLNGEKAVRLYTVVPIYTEERDYEKNHGILALLKLLQERGYTTVVDINRPNVAIE